MKQVKSFSELLPTGGVGVEPSPIVGELVESEKQDSQLFTDPHHSRGDAKLLTQMLTLGVVSAEESKKFIARAFELGMQTDSPREYAALAKVIQSAAKLEMEAEKQNKPKTPQLHLHGHVDATQSTRHSLAAIAAKAGLPRLAERCSGGEFGGS